MDRRALWSLSMDFSDFDASPRGISFFKKLGILCTALCLYVPKCHFRNHSFSCNTTRADLDPTTPLLDEQKMPKETVEKYQPVSGFHHKYLLFHLKLSAVQNVRVWGVYLGFSNFSHLHSIWQCKCCAVVPCAGTTNLRPFEWVHQI